MNIDEATTEAFRLSKLLDDALGYAKRQVQEYASNEAAYRKARAEAWQTAPEGTVPEREAFVDGVTAGQRHARDLADGMRQLGLEAIRSRRAQLSALQSLLAMERSEMELAR